MFKTGDVKKYIEINKKEISALLTGSSFRRLNTFNWIRHELTTEAEILFQLPNHMHKRLYLDYNNIKNLGDAWDYVLDNRDTPIDTFQIRTIHTILCKNTLIQPGAYRLSEVYSEQLGIHAPTITSVIYHMDDIQYALSDKKRGPLINAFNVHYDLIALQPFNDFNKRTARIVMNWILIQNGYQPILFNHKSDKKEYMSALRARTDRDCKEYSKYMYNGMLRTQKSIIKILKDSRAF
jgi:Fic family protein